MIEIPVIETQRLVLDAHRAGDFEAMHAMYADEAVYRHTTGQPQTLEEVWNRLLRLAGCWQMLGYGYWAVRHRQSGRYAGCLGFADMRRDLDPPAPPWPESGWLLAAWAHGQGLATEGVAAAHAWLDTRTHYERSFCIIHPDNAASLRVARRIGYGEIAAVKFRGEDNLTLRRTREASAEEAVLF